MIEGAKPLRVGDICCPESRIVSVTNSSEGKIVKVKGHWIRNFVKIFIKAVMVSMIILK